MSFNHRDLTITAISKRFNCWSGCADLEIESESTVWQMNHTTTEPPCKSEMPKFWTNDGKFIFHYCRQISKIVNFNSMTDKFTKKHQHYPVSLPLNIFNRNGCIQCLLGNKITLKRARDTWFRHTLISFYCLQKQTKFSRLQKELNVFKLFDR